MFLRLLMHVAELPSRKVGPSEMSLHPDQFTDSRLYPWKRSAEAAKVNSSSRGRLSELYPHLLLCPLQVRCPDKNKLTQPASPTARMSAQASFLQVDTGAKSSPLNALSSYGIEADDNPFFDLSVYFLPVARYIRSALSVPQGQLS